MESVRFPRKLLDGDNTNVLLDGTPWEHALAVHAVLEFVVHVYSH